jgi:hypothetical protein
MKRKNPRILPARPVRSRSGLSSLARRSDANGKQNGGERPRSFETTSTIAECATNDGLAENVRRQCQLTRKKSPRSGESAIRCRLRVRARYKSPNSRMSMVSSVGQSGIPNSTADQCGPPAPPLSQWPTCPNAAICPARSVLRTSNRSSPGDIDSRVADPCRRCSSSRSCSANATKTPRSTQHAVSAVNTVCLLVTRRWIANWVSLSAGEPIAPRSLTPSSRESSPSRNSTKTADLSRCFPRTNAEPRLDPAPHSHQ